MALCHPHYYFFGKWIWRFSRCYEKTKRSFKFFDLFLYPFGTCKYCHKTFLITAWATHQLPYAQTIAAFGVAEPSVDRILCWCWCCCWPNNTRKQLSLGAEVFVGTPPTKVPHQLYWLLETLPKWIFPEEWKPRWSPLDSTLTTSMTRSWKMGLDKPESHQKPLPRGWW